MPSKSLKKTERVSAQVVLRPAGGRSVRNASLITAANPESFTPAPDAVAAARKAMADAGFEVGEMVGNSFSITTPVSTFEGVFKTRLRRSSQGGVVTGSGTLELPLRHLPKEVVDLIEAVTFTAPPDFGPTDYRK